MSFYKGYKQAAISHQTISVFLWLLLSLTSASAISANLNTSNVNSLLALDLEQLLNYEVVAPTKSETKLAETPGSVSVITYDQIRKSAARTIPELLRAIPGVNVRWNPMVQTIDIRNFGGSPFTSRVLLLIDGIPYNSWNKGGFPQHPGFDFFNLENVKHIEIIRGAGSALYGENALNGVINIVTLSGDEYRQTRGSVYSGDRNTRSYSVSHGRKLGDDASVFMSVRSEQTQLPNEIWLEHDSKAKAKDLFLKAKYKGLQLSYYRRQDEFDGFDETIVPPDFGFRSIDKIEQTVNIAAARFQHKSEDNNWSFEMNTSYSEREGTHCGGCHAASQSPAFNESIDHGYQMFGNVQLGIHAFDQHDLLLGAEMRRVSAGDSFDIVPSVHDPIEKTAYNKPALFIQDKIKLIEGKLELIAGLRYDAETSENLFEDEIFPRLMAVAKLSPDLTLRAGWTKAARYPSFTELYQNIQFFAPESASIPGLNAFPGSSFKANPLLTPEHVESFELGLQYEVSPKLHTKFDVYLNRLTDPIVLVYGANVVGFENHPNDINICGIEAEIKAEIGSHITSYINGSYQKNKEKGSGFDSAGMPIEFSYSPRYKANLGAVYRSHQGFSATLEYSWQDKSDAPKFWSNIVFGAGSSQELDDYGYLNLMIKYRVPIDFGFNKRPLSISVNAKNLGNERPYETLTASGGRVASGREFFIALDYELAN